MDSPNHEDWLWDEAVAGPTAPKSPKEIILGENQSMSDFDENSFNWKDSSDDDRLLSVSSPTKEVGKKC